MIGKNILPLCLIWGAASVGLAGVIAADLSVGPRATIAAATAEEGDAALGGLPDEDCYGDGTLDCGYFAQLICSDFLCEEVEEERDPNNPEAPPATDWFCLDGLYDEVTQLTYDSTVYDKYGRSGQADMPEIHCVNTFDCGAGLRCVQRSDGRYFCAMTPGQRIQDVKSPVTPTIVDRASPYCIAVAEQNPKAEVRTPAK